MSRTTLLYILAFLSLIPLLALRDFSPTNELRYVGIAQDALTQHHFFAFYLQGEIYADKPPFFFWLMMLEKVVFGQFSVLALGMLNLIPAFLVVWLMNKWTKNTLSPTERLAASAMLITTGLFLGTAIIIRMDMLMTLFVVLSLYTFFRIYQNVHRPYEKWLLPVYLFMGMFTKWPVGAFFPLLAIGVFLLWKKQVWQIFKYIGIPQILIFLALTAVWWIGAYREGGLEYLQNLLLKQTMGRAVDSFHHKEPFYFYLVSMWYSLAPWVFLYVVGLFYAVRKKLLETDMEKLFVSVILSLFVFLSIVSAKLQIYLLPIFPFLTFFAMLMVKKSPGMLGYRLSVLIPGVLFLLPIPAFFIFRKKIDIPESAIPYVLAAMLALGVSAGYSLYLKKAQILQKIMALSAGLLGCIFIFSFSIPSLNGYIGMKTMTDAATKIAQSQQIASIYYYPFRSGEFLSFYFGKEIKALPNLGDKNTWPKERFLLLIKTVEAKKDPILKKAIEGKQMHNSGLYSVVEF